MNNLSKITEGMTGQEVANLIYGNDTALLEAIFGITGIFNDVAFLTTNVNEMKISLTNQDQRITQNTTEINGLISRVEHIETEVSGVVMPMLWDLQSSITGLSNRIEEATLTGIWHSEQIYEITQEITGLSVRLNEHGMTGIYLLEREQDITDVITGMSADIEQLRYDLDHITGIDQGLIISVVDDYLNTNTGIVTRDNLESTLFEVSTGIVTLPDLPYQMSGIIGALVPEHDVYDGVRYALNSVGCNNLYEFIMRYGNITGIS